MDLCELLGEKEGDTCAENYNAKLKLRRVLGDCAEELLSVVEIAGKRPNKFGPHFMIWMDQMDAALTALREKEGKVCR